MIIPVGYLKKFRQLKGSKQQSVAKKLCKSQQAYAKMENRPDMEKSKLEELLQAMSCSLQDWKNFIVFYPPPR